MKDSQYNFTKNTKFKLNTHNYCFCYANNNHCHICESKHGARTGTKKKKKKNPVQNEKMENFHNISKLANVVISPNTDNGARARHNEKISIP